MIRLAFDSFRLVLLPTDLLLFLLLFATIGFLLVARRREYYRVAWRQIVARPLAMACMGVCLLYASVALLDSVRYQKRAAAADGTQQKTEKGDPVYGPERRRRSNPPMAGRSGATRGSSTGGPRSQTRRRSGGRLRGSLSEGSCSGSGSAGC